MPKIAFCAKWFPISYYNYIIILSTLIISLYIIIIIGDALTPGHMKYPPSFYFIKIGSLSTPPLQAMNKAKRIPSHGLSLKLIHGGCH